MKVQIDKDIEELIPGYLEGREKELRELKDLASSESFNEVSIVGHKLKGNAGSYGFDQMSEIGKELEDGGNAKDIEQIDFNLQNS